MANGWFLLPAPRPPVETPIEVAAQMALGRWSGCGVVEAA